MRLIIKGAVALFLLLAISIPLSAQYIVQGVVTDSLTREPLSYVSVRLKNTTEGTTTGSDGRFYFKTHRSEGVLVISTVGYNEYSRLIHPARNQENNCQQHNRDHGTTMPVVSAEIASNQTTHNISTVIEHVQYNVVCHRW